MSQLPKTITCPNCSNVNAYTADECIKCGLKLEPIRKAMNGTKASPPAPAQTSTPSIPKLPKLPKRSNSTADLGRYENSWGYFVRGTASQTSEVTARFISNIQKRKLPHISISTGQLVFENERHPHYFAEKELGQSAKTTMAVRIDAVGTDLIVQWRHYVLPPKEFDWGAALVGVGLLIAAYILFSVTINGGPTGQNVAFLVAPIVAILGLGSLVAAPNKRSSGLKGFQSQISNDFRLVIEAALEVAIDEARISRSLIQRMPSGQSGRVI